MKINAGKFKGFPILTKDIPGTRPTSDKVKQAIFNILGAAVDGKSVLDLFAGFGSLGLEALSRGADSVAFVEKNHRCAQIILENIQKVRGQAQTRILTMDVFRAIDRLAKGKDSFSLVFADAPYDLALEQASLSLNSKLLNVLSDSGIITAGALLVVQRDKRENLIFDADVWQILQEKQYGDTIITLYKARG